jgi:acetyl esterase
MALDRELAMFEHFQLPDFADVPAVRQWLKSLSDQSPPLDRAISSGISITEQNIPGPTNAPPIRIRIYRSSDSGPAPVLVYFHSGSFLMGGLETDHVSCLNYARMARSMIISVDYRLAPEHRFPAGVEDCYEALVWASNNAATLGIDSARMALGGSSAGATLAAAVAIMTRDRHGPTPLLQLLIYPALDDRMNSQSINSVDRQYVDTRAVIGHMWRHYLGGSGNADSPYAAPARVTDLTALAPAYIEACELDPLRDEAVDYAMRLLRGGVSTELHVIAGAVHGFEMAASANVTQRAFHNRAAAIRRAFGISADSMRLLA